MDFIKHLNLEGKHAWLSASKHTWLNYDNETLCERYVNSWATTVGTLLHALAENYIKYSTKMLKSDLRIVKLYLEANGVPSNVINGLDIEMMFNNLMQYINDGVGFKMSPEVVLYYSDNCFGTADTISYRNGQLRIHDLKTGTSPVHMDQLNIYAALFFLEYGKMTGAKPENTEMELRIYQCGDVLVYNPTPEDIYPIMDRIKESNEIIEQLRL